MARGAKKLTRRERRQLRREAAARTGVSVGRAAGNDGYDDDCPICVMLRELEASGRAHREELPPGLAELGFESLRIDLR